MIRCGCHTSEFSVAAVTYTNLQKVDPRRWDSILEGSTDWTNWEGGGKGEEHNGKYPEGMGRVGVENDQDTVYACRKYSRLKSQQRPLAGSSPWKTHSSQ